eukprot:1892525-Rhodomonas_salina.2
MYPFTVPFCTPSRPLGSFRTASDCLCVHVVAMCGTDLASGVRRAVLTRYGVRCAGRRTQTGEKARCNGGRGGAGGEGGEGEGVLGGQKEMSDTARRCLVLTWGMVLPGRPRKSRRDSGSEEEEEEEVQ